MLIKNGTRHQVLKIFIWIEAFIHGGQWLHCYLTLLFNLCLKHGYLPDAFNNSILIPLVKNKTGDITHVDNYRAIALSNSVTKLLEGILMRFIDSHVACDDYQFGFVKQQSTANCTCVFKKQSIITKNEVAMSLLVSLISRRHLIMLITGCYFVRCVTVVYHILVYLPLVYLHTSIVIS